MTLLNNPTINQSLSGDCYDIEAGQVDHMRKINLYCLGYLQCDEPKSRLSSQNRMLYHYQGWTSFLGLVQ